MNSTITERKITAHDHESQEIDIIPISLIYLYEKAFLDGADPLDAETFLSAIYSHLVFEGGEKPSALFRAFSSTLGSMSNHWNESVRFQAKDIIRELKLQSTIPWNDLTGEYWLDSYTEQAIPSLEFNSENPAKIEGWRNWVLEQKPYDDQELNEQFVEANIHAVLPRFDPPQYEDRGYEPEHFKPEVELTSDWYNEFGDFISEYYQRLNWMREYLSDKGIYISNDYEVWGADATTFDFIETVFAKNEHMLETFVSEHSYMLTEEKAQLAFQLEGVEIPSHAFGITSEGRKAKLDINIIGVDQIISNFEKPYKVENFIQRFEDEILDKLTSDGAMSPKSYTSYERIEEMSRIALDQIISTFDETGEPKQTQAWNEGYILAMIDRGYESALPSAWDYYRNSISPAGADAFNLHENMSKAWKAFHIISHKTGDVKDVVVSLAKDGAVVAPEYNTNLKRKVGWYIVRKKLQAGEFNIEGLRSLLRTDLRQLAVERIPSRAKLG